MNDSVQKGIAAIEDAYLYQFEYGSFEDAFVCPSGIWSGDESYILDILKDNVEVYINFGNRNDEINYPTIQDYLRHVDYWVEKIKQKGNFDIPIEINFLENPFPDLVRLTNIKG